MKMITYSKTFTSGNLNGLTVKATLTASDVSLSHIVVGYTGRDIITGAAWTVTAVEQTLCQRVEHITARRKGRACQRICTKLMNHTGNCTFSSWGLV